MLRKNTAGQFICFSGINATTGAALTGATFSCRRCLDGTFAAATGTISEDTGLGFYKMALSQADTNGNNCAYFFTATNAIPVTINVITTACDPTSTAFGLSLAKTTNITGFNDIAATAIVSSGAITTSGGAVSTVTTTTTATNVTTVNGLAAGVITAASIAADAITAAKVAADVGLEIADAVWDEATAGHVTAGTTGKALTDILDDTGTSGVVVDAGSKTGYSLAAGGAGSGAIAAAELNNIADAILDRNMATGTDSGSTTVRTPRQAMRVMRNKVAISAGTATIYKEDDTTSSWTAAVTTTAGDPISAVDPAGP